MLSRRGFVGCALCALAGFSATDAGAQTPGLKRTLLSRVDGPAAGYETIEAKVEIPAGSVVARHTHFGVETGYVIEGELNLVIDGVGARKLAAGEGFQILPGVPHGGKNGDSAVTLVSVYVVEKGKPLATPA